MKYKATFTLLVFIILLAFITFFRFEDLYIDNLRENIKDVIYFIMIGWFIYRTYQTEWKKDYNKNIQ